MSTMSNINTYVTTTTTTNTDNNNRFPLWIQTFSEQVDMYCCLFGDTCSTNTFLVDYVG